MPTKRTPETVQPCESMLQGIGQICAFMDISKPMFYEFLKIGMPCLYFGNRYHANTANLIRWHEKITAVAVVRTGRIPIEPEEEGEENREEKPAPMVRAFHALCPDRIRPGR